MLLVAELLVEMPAVFLQRLLQEHGEVCISALGIAVSPAVTVAEILKSRQLATEKAIHTSLESIGELPRQVCS